jgi:hypothetical protein
VRNQVVVRLQHLMADMSCELYALAARARRARAHGSETGSPVPPPPGRCAQKFAVCGRELGRRLVPDPCTERRERLKRGQDAKAPPAQWAAFRAEEVPRPRCPSQIARHALTLLGSRLSHTYGISQ